MKRDPAHKMTLMNIIIHYKCKDVPSPVFLTKGNNVFFFITSYLQYSKNPHIQM